MATGDETVLREEPEVAAPPPARASEAPSRGTRLIPWLGLAACLLAVALVRVEFLTTPLERDEGEFAYAGQLILAGEKPYASMYAMKLPGIYLTYALIEALFGQTAWAIHFGLLLVNLASIVLVFVLARRMTG
ncbi:MAG: hypothetical protein JNG90_12705, partial [Planctomycetaceae bacterium]|nr:hypothetical protein [Planctomycetaceae bacterium]